MLRPQRLGFSNLIVDLVPLAQTAVEEEHMAIFSSLYTWSSSDPSGFFSFSNREEKKKVLLQREGRDGDSADP